jgi:hypothetical protein
MHVHIPKAWDQVLPAPIHYASVPRYSRARRSSHGRDAIPAHYDRAVAQARARGDVDHRYVRDSCGSRVNVWGLSRDRARHERDPHEASKDDQAHSLG